MAKGRRQTWASCFTSVVAPTRAIRCSTCASPIWCMAPGMLRTGASSNSAPRSPPSAVVNSSCNAVLEFCPDASLLSTAAGVARVVFSGELATEGERDGNEVRLFSSDGEAWRPGVDPLPRPLLRLLEGLMRSVPGGLRELDAREPVPDEERSWATSPADEAMPDDRAACAGGGRDSFWGRRIQRVPKGEAKCRRHR